MNSEVAYRSLGKPTKSQANEKMLHLHRYKSHIDP